MASKYLATASHLKRFSSLVTFSPQIASAYHSNVPAVRRHISHRSYHWSRQPKIEEKLEKYRDYSERLNIIECWLSLGKDSLLGPSRVREIIETQILKLEHEPGIFASFGGFALLYRLSRLQAENPEYNFRIDYERMSDLAKDGMAKHMREEHAPKPQNPGNHIRVDGSAINDHLGGPDKGKHEAFTLKLISDDEGHLIFLKTDSPPSILDHWSPPLYILCFKDVESVSWPASKKSQREVTVMMMNGDEINFLANQRKEAEQIAWKLKRSCGL